MSDDSHTGSETIGAAGERSRMTLFRDDRAEDLGAILLAIVVVALVVVLTAFKAPSPPAASGASPAPAGAAAPGPVR